MWKHAVWLGVPKRELEKWNILEGDLTGRFAYYRCEAELDEPAELTIDISANSRYRLWVNGRPVLSGPCKGDLYRHYYETVDLTEYLKIGKNILAVQVLFSNAYTAVKQTDERAGIFGVLTPGGGHRLAVEGELRNADGKRIGSMTTGSADWKVYLDGSFYLRSYAATENLGAVCEELDFQKLPGAWKTEQCDTSDWSVPSELETVKNNHYFKSVGLVPRFIMREREIPLLYETEDTFEKELETSAIPVVHILEKGKVCVKAGETKKVLLDAGRIVNSYPCFTFCGGKGAEIRITYFEKFVHETKIIQRDDAENGTISGITDCIRLNGEPVVYEPFWYRTFRFLYMEIEVKDETAEVYAPIFRKTGYPLEVISNVKSSEPWVGEVWDLCVRTLENCMMETYMDCPYYEQMQFPMDTRLQALFTYMVSGDRRLAKKALEDYHCSMIPEGLIHGKYPSAYPQIISTFSLHYIYMLWEYFWQTGELWEVRQYFPDMDRILDYYDRKIGEDGLVGKLGYWEFVDWQDAWSENGGVPSALLHGPSAIINLMYAYALECAAKLNETAGRTGMADEYRKRKEKILKEIHTQCWDEERGMYREGPSYPQYTCHAQAWAVLNRLPDMETAKNMLRRAAEEEDVLKCSFSTAYEWFRACEQAGIYGVTKPDLKRWIDLPALGCTCCPETPGNTRSDCHAWSALPMYELVCAMAGIRAGEAGWKSVRIEPHLEGLTDLEGQAVTPKGNVKFVYRRKNDADGSAVWDCHITMPAGLDGEFIDGDSNVRLLRGGQQYDFCFQ